ASILAYRDLGYLPETMLSFLARLGWSHGDQEEFEKDELFRFFDLDACGKSAGIFDFKKLLWQNARRIPALTPAALLERTAPFLAKESLDPAAPWLLRAMPGVQERSETLVAVAMGLKPFYDRRPKIDVDPKAAEKFLTPENRATVAQLADALESVDP